MVKIYIEKYRSVLFSLNEIDVFFYIMKSSNISDNPQYSIFHNHLKGPSEIKYILNVVNWVYPIYV